MHLLFVEQRAATGDEIRNEGASSMGNSMLGVTIDIVEHTCSQQRQWLICWAALCVWGWELSLFVYRIGFRYRQATKLLGWRYWLIAVVVNGTLYPRWPSMSEVTRLRGRLTHGKSNDLGGLSGGSSCLEIQNCTSPFLCKHSWHQDLDNRLVMGYLPR